MDILSAMILFFLAAVAVGCPIYLIMRERINTLADVNDKLRVELDKLRAREDAALSVVRAVEWLELSVPTIGEPKRATICPCCLADKPAHKPVCQLAALLKPVGEANTPTA